jgi:hypothetical protein
MRDGEPVIGDIVEPVEWADPKPTLPQSIARSASPA